MKKLCAAICMISLLIIGVSSSGYAQAEGVVAIWLFDEGSGDTVKDFFNGHDGEIQGSLKWVDGRFGKALEFPGTEGNYVSVPHKDSLDLTTWTITAWVKVEDTEGEFQCFIRKAEPANVRNYSMKVAEVAKGVGDVPQMGFTSGGWFEIFGTTELTDGKWHHIAGTYDQTAGRIYVDGVLEAEGGSTAIADTNPGPLTIGATLAGTGPVKGIIDDFGLFEEALDEEEISTIMNDGLGRVYGVGEVDAMGKLATTWAALKGLGCKGK